MSFSKIQTISTVLAILSVILSCALVFLGMVDQMLRLDLFPQAWEAFLVLGAWGFGTIALGSCAISAILSLYRMSLGK